MCLLSSDYDAIELSKPSSLPHLCDCLIIKSRTLKSVFIIVYKSVSCSSADTIKLLEAFDDMMSEYTRYGYTISKLGDLNFRDIRWNVEPPEADSMLSIALLEFINAWDMTQIVTQPTRGKNVLDVIITTSPAIYTECHNMPADGKSDHDVVTCQIITHYCAVRNGGVYKRINYDALQLQLLTIDWRTLTANTVDVDDLWKIFHDVLNMAICNCTQIALPRSEYVPQCLRTLFLHKKRRWKIRKSQPSEKNKCRYKMTWKKLTAAIRQYRSREESTLLSKFVSGFYRHISSQLRSHDDDHIVLTGSDGQELTESSDICNAFVSEFALNYSSAMAVDFAISLTECSAFQVDISFTALLSVVLKIPNIAAGPNDIPTKVYKCCISSLARPLLSIYQQSLFQGRIPCARKIAKVIPIYKGKGSKQAASSYPPISLTSVACKILERLFVQNLTEYLNDSE